MDETDRLILYAIRKMPDCTIREIAKHIFYSYDCVRKHLRAGPLSKLIWISGVRPRAGGCGGQPATYRIADGVEFCETCGQVIE